MASISKDDINDVKDAAESVCDSMSGKVHKLFHCASDEISQATDTVTRRVKDNPVQSSLIALSVGFVFGSLFRRS